MICNYPWWFQSIGKESLGPRDPGSPKLRMVVEPKDYAFRRWLNIPISIWQYDWMPRESSMKHKIVSVISCSLITRNMQVCKMEDRTCTLKSWLIWSCSFSLCARVKPRTTWSTGCHWQTNSWTFSQLCNWPLTVFVATNFRLSTWHCWSKFIESSWWLNHPFEKYARQIGSFPQVGVKITNVWNHHLVVPWTHLTSSNRVYKLDLSRRWSKKTDLQGGHNLHNRWLFGPPTETCILPSSARAMEWNLVHSLDCSPIKDAIFSPRVKNHRHLQSAWRTSIYIYI